MGIARIYPRTKPMPRPSRGSSERIKVIIDTREQLPYSFDDEKVESERRKLGVGDYSLDGFEDRVVVERKTMNDFVNSVIHHSKRFYRELRQLSEYELACVVVKASLEEIYDGLYVSAAHPHAVFGSAISIIVDFGVPVFFCCTRQLACRFTEAFLIRAARRLINNEDKDKGAG